MKYALVSFALAATLSGCASVPMGDVQRDGALKNFVPPAGVAGVYVYRNESMGGAVKMDVSIDGQDIGQTAAKTYLYKEVSPGKHAVSSKAENTDTLEFEAKAGSLIYIWQEVKMGLMFARTKLHLMDEAQGRQGVAQTKLANTR